MLLEGWYFSVFFSLLLSHLCGPSQMYIPFDFCLVLSNVLDLCSNGCYKSSYPTQLEMFQVEVSGWVENVCGVLILNPFYMQSTPLPSGLLPGQVFQKMEGMILSRDLASNTSLIIPWFIIVLYINDFIQSVLCILFFMWFLPQIFFRSM